MRGVGRREVRRAKDSVRRVVRAGQGLSGMACSGIGGELRLFSASFLVFGFGVCWRGGEKEW